ncbi:hypothetical protein MEA186_29042 [Mesorhizobium amorphae CCNWGS0123]|uniref:Uncharacterized protein n=1 Tax=Mesorhizobium amorphae CCNWGS0123 TaxID=1082933 RepID=G6YII3_9HYPH|nr:hypothetical protein A6B35_33925 [Mesorhizobium amorphae CCNWGS0123]EHH06244.1 hypothetical protein MEA186_29042 [Mesorhizobium amorphae CCNWGS0123]
MIFERWLHQERGLSNATVQAYCAAADHFFFFWSAGKGVALNAIMRKTKHRGIARVAAHFMLNLIAYNLIRIPKLVAA